MTYSAATSIFVTLLAVGVPCVEARAQAPTTGYDEDRFFVDVAAGFGYIHTKPLTADSPLVDQAASYTSSVAGLDWSAGVGYLWRLGRFAWGARIGYSTFHDSAYSIQYNNGDVAQITYRNSNIDLLGILKFHFTPDFGLAAQLGYSYVLQQVDTIGMTQDIRMQGHVPSAPTVGAELSYGLTPNLWAIVSSRYTVGEVINPGHPHDRGERAGVRSTNAGLSLMY